MSYYSARVAEFAQMCKDAQWGTTLKRNGLEKVCTKSPEAIMLQMTEGPYSQEVASTYDILREDWVTLRLADLETFTSGEFTWQVFSHLDDDKEPTIQFKARKLQ